MAEAGQVTARSPIINDPYTEPSRHWHFEEGKEPEVRDGRRVSGYLPPGGEGELAITGELVQMELVNDLRARVRKWREDGYPGATLSPTSCWTGGSTLTVNRGRAPSSPRRRHWKPSFF